ncbi:hypothetical protein HHL16_12210 [Pseudoflavitalea sp. G-6-1-2]|uniref:FecR domain-containing protein n=1 Tax=Pseudoflavitalea sp. G-6-1-2 TaxID=2728841 RepID=UPI00146BAD2B|nr:FecR domain-containing protein [Pseudoflavitalea sp. G-6-1-2]NML21645.1 hypothetical protein [Pseudoflavitalea sp. G-6-1-2]
MKKNGIILIALLIVSGTALLYLMFRSGQPVKEPGFTGRDTIAGSAVSGDTFVPPADTFPFNKHAFEEKLLKDSSRVLVLEGSSVKQSGSGRQVLADGELIFQIPQRSLPFVVNTRILQLTVLQPSIFRVSAFSHENGELIEVLEGAVEAKKRYQSDFPEKDTVRSAELLMINDQIDLMEKEKDSLKPLRQWWTDRK